MAKKTVISKVMDVEAQDGIIVFPQNRTLYADQFTDKAPTTDEDRAGIRPTSMKEVFDHYRPKVEGVLLKTEDTEDGECIYEDFHFHSLKDFEDDQLIAQSELLGMEKGKIDALNAVIAQLGKNKSLRNALKDQAARGNLANALKALLAELEEKE